MSDEPTVVLPRGCTLDAVRVYTYAKTQKDYDRIVEEAKEGKYFMEGGEDDRRWVSWENKVTGISFQVGCPTPEMEEQFNFDELSRRYRK